MVYMKTTKMEHKDLMLVDGIVVIMGWKKEVLESIKESIQIEAFPEIIFLSKYVGDFNITKVGENLVFENNGHCVVLKRDEII